MGRHLPRPAGFERRARVSSRASATLLALAGGIAHSPARAADAAGAPSDDATTNREPTRQEIEAYLDSHGLPKGDGQRAAPLEVPPLPPRSRGWVLETGVGAVFQLGALRHVSPPSPWLGVHLGYEVAEWFMVLANADLTLADTSYAARPPEPRTYAHYAIGAGGRFQFRMASWLAAHAQLELGVSEVTEDVLEQYGYRQADSLNFHYGARVGLDWLQVNPHLALGLQGTLRNYSGLDRTNNADTPLAAIGALTFRYAF